MDLIDGFDRASPGFDSDCQPGQAGLGGATITELGVVPSIVHLILLYCDNHGFIAQVKEPWSHQRSKHVLRRYHLI